MKVKFLSKKQRQVIKAQKESNFQPALVRNIDQSTHVSATYKQTYKQSIRQSLGSQNEDRIINKSNNTGKQNPYSEHLIGGQKDNSFEEIRERSRDIKYKELRKDDVEERVNLKKKLLGLEKIEQSHRRNSQYRSRLLFEWDKSEDTTKGFAPILTQQQLYGVKKDVLNSQDLQTWKTKPFQKMSERDWRIFREDHEIYIRGGKAPDPVRNWKQIQGASDILLQNLESINFERPKPIQMQAIPIGMIHKDLMAIAPTGEGKTLAYLFPIIHFLLPLQRMTMNNFDQGPFTLILVPTRQLAEQVDQEFKRFTKNMNLRSFVAVGGRQFQLQSIELSKGCDILIATPGRVKQFIDKHQLSLQRLTWCVVDEADKMVSQNLSDDLQFILDNAGQNSLFNGKKIIHMFSATMIPEVQKLGRSYLSASYTYITIGQPGGGKKQIDQHVELIDQNAKSDRLIKILRGLAGPLIVFVNSRQKCEKIATMVLKRIDRNVAEYHGGKSQEQREKVISNLRTGKVEILIATDLAGRGLDVKGINAVINYDAPKNISEFVHRSGRTGRAGMKGKAYTLLTADDQSLFYDLRVFLQRNGFNIPENLRNHPAAMVRPGGVLTVKKSKQIVYTN